MTTVYVVAEIGWEYDDQSYWASDARPGALGVFATIEDATAEADRLTIASLKWRDFDEFQEYIDWPGAEIDTFIENHPHISKDEWGRVEVERDKISNQDLMKLFNLANIHFYEVLEMEVQ